MTPSRSRPEPAPRPTGPGPSAAAAVAPRPVGSVLAPGYTVREHLARGATLDVYEVWSHERSCSCVAKALRPDRAATGPAGDRLRGEAALLLSLSHPGLVRAYEWYDGSLPAVIMETVPGETLGHLIERRHRPLSSEDLVELTHQLISVIGYLHRHDTMHLDLKPSNIVAAAGRACVLDLSHARSPGPCPPGFGTAEYMSPEQLTGGVVTERSDVYGLAGVLYRAATRRRPFSRDAREVDPRLQPSFRALRRRTLPRAFVEWIVAGFDPEPRHRPTVRQIAAALADCD